VLAPIRISLVLLLICGGVYPTAVTLVGQLAFPYQADGSLVRDAKGDVIGSELLAQAFDKPGYFHPRPSAAGADGYDATASSGSNLGPTNHALIDRVKSAVDEVKGDDPGIEVVPADLVTTSGSGLDPDITVDAAMAQVPRVAKARGIAEQQVRDLVRAHVTGRDLGIFGDARVNVLKLNLALDALKG
jgi:potassium-transporting ATPase KdpC subunit